MEANEFLYESHFQALWNTINFLGRGMAFFLAINAAVFGYFFTADLEADIANRVLLLGLLTSVLFAICSATCIWWCRQMGASIKRSLQEHAPDEFVTFDVEANFRRGQFLFLTFGVCMLGLVGAIIVAYLYLLV